MIHAGAMGRIPRVPLRLAVELSWIGPRRGSETNIIDNTRIRVFSEGLPSFETEKSAKGIR